MTLQRYRVDFTGLSKEETRELIKQLNYVLWVEPKYYLPEYYQEVAIDPKYDLKARLGPLFDRLHPLS